MAIYVSRHVRQRISERAGVDMTSQDVLDLIPHLDLERMETGAHVVTKVKSLALDLVCRDRALTTALHHHNWQILGVPRTPRRRIKESRVRQAHLDAGEEIVVGGRVRRIEA